LQAKTFMIANPIICALDTQDLKEAVHLANTLRNKVGTIKLGLEFFTANGLLGLEKIAECGVPIFLDLKLHDIPNTVCKTIEVIKNLNVEMLTLHVSGGRKMLEDALNVVEGTKIKLIGVTVLTSMSDEDLNELGIKRETNSQVMLLASLAKKIRLYGVVCSALEVQEVRRKCGKDFKIITPGIRIDHGSDDQKRTATPKEAMESGADYIVIGRPITKSYDPASSAESILKSLNT
jgi:orotidine-5'-phosphate decarboxylase